MDKYLNLYNLSSGIQKIHNIVNYDNKSLNLVTEFSLKDKN